jgi:hypothetical protein
VNSVLNLRVPLNAGKLLSVLTTGGLSSGAQLRREYRSRYSYWLRAGRPRGRSSSPGRIKNFHLSFRPASYPIDIGGKAAGE